MKKGDIVRVERLEAGITQHTVEGQVMWAVEDQASVQDKENKSAYLVFDPRDSDYKVTVLIDSSPSFQSQVASLSDEELKAAVDAMRGNRIQGAPEPKVKKASAPKLNKEELELLTLMNALSPEEQLALKGKLGI